jgi:hypothetical protein
MPDEHNPSPDHRAAYFQRSEPNQNTPTVMANRVNPHPDSSLRSEEEDSIGVPTHRYEAKAGNKGMNDPTQASIQRLTMIEDTSGPAFTASAIQHHVLQKAVVQPRPCVKEAARQQAPIERYASFLARPNVAAVGLRPFTGLGEHPFPAHTHRRHVSLGGPAFCYPGSGPDGHNSPHSLRRQETVHGCASFASIPRGETQPLARRPAVAEVLPVARNHLGEAAFEPPRPRISESRAAAFYHPSLSRGSIVQPAITPPNVPSVGRDTDTQPIHNRIDSAARGQDNGKQNSLHCRRPRLIRNIQIVL